MSIVPVASLSASDLFLLGNNVRPERSERPERRRRPPRRVLDAVNRSLAAHGEAVAALHRHWLGPRGLATSPQRIRP